MPIYNTSSTKSLVLNPVPATVLWPGDEVYLLGTSFKSGNPPTPGIPQGANDSNVQFEAAIATQRSIAIALAPRPGGGAPPGLIIQITASADPGASEIDVQDAVVDADGAYLTPTSATYKITAWTHSGALFTAWAEFQPESGPFVSLLVVTNANGVKWTAKAKYV
jgi:hypothetical protein